MTKSLNVGVVMRMFGGGGWARRGEGVGRYCPGDGVQGAAEWWGARWEAVGWQGYDNIGLNEMLMRRG